LASNYGLVPDDWQEDVLESWLGRKSNDRWSAATCGLAVPRQNGKNALLEIRELFGMVALGEKFLHTAHEVKTARKAFLRIASFFENEREYPELRALVKEIRKTNGQEAIVLTNGGSCEFIARSKGSGRGFTVDVLVCDEAQDLTSEELAALLPTISASPTGNPQVILTGTPPKPTGSQGEVFRSVREDGEANRDARLAWTDFGVADGPLPDCEDRTVWAAVNPALFGRLNIAEVEREIALMRSDLEGFARERLGWWGDPDTETAGVIDLAQWAALKGDAEPPERATLVVDVSPDRKRASIGVAAEARDGRVLVMVTTGPGVAWIVPELVRLREKRDIVEIALQPTSQAGSLIPDMVKAGVEFEALTSTQMGQACASFIEGVKQKRFVHVGQHELDAAVGNARTRFSREAELWDRRNRAIDISPLVAASAAAFRVSSLAKSKQSFAF